MELKQIDTLIRFHQGITNDFGPFASQSTVAMEEQTIKALEELKSIKASKKMDTCPRCGSFEATCDGKRIKCLKCGLESPGVSWDFKEAA